MQETYQRIDHYFK